MQKLWLKFFYVAGKIAPPFSAGCDIERKSTTYGGVFLRFIRQGRDMVLGLRKELCKGACFVV